MSAAISRPFTSLCAAVGRPALALIQYLGELALLVQETTVSVFVAPMRWKLFLRQIAEMGFRSQI